MTTNENAEKVEQLLKQIGIQKVLIDVAENNIAISSCLPPSQLLTSIRSTGLSAFLRGISTPISLNSTAYTLPMAGVCIFEAFKGATAGWIQDINKGVARMIQLDENQIFLDVALDQLSPSTQYHIHLHECGDLSQGFKNVGASIRELGSFVSNHQGKGEYFKEVQNLQMHQVIGRSLVLWTDSKSAEDAVGGIIARSAGYFENKKEICSCSGKTIWEETSKL